MRGAAGGVRSTRHVVVAGALRRPSRSRTRTWNSCGPSASAARSTGLVQGAKVALSRRHSNEPLPAKTKRAAVELVTSAGRSTIAGGAGAGAIETVRVRAQLFCSELSGTRRSASAHATTAYRPVGAGTLPRRKNDCPGRSEGIRKDCSLAPPPVENRSIELGARLRPEFTTLAATTMRTPGSETGVAVTAAVRRSGFPFASASGTATRPHRRAVAIRAWRHRSVKENLVEGAPL